MYDINTEIFSLLLERVCVCVVYYCVYTCGLFYSRTNTEVHNSHHPHTCMCTPLYMHTHTFIQLTQEAPLPLVITYVEMWKMLKNLQYYE